MSIIAQLGRLAAQEVKAADDDDRWPKSKGSLDDIVGHADDSPNGPNDDSDDSGDDSSGDIGD
jgi:hypothetical protein